MRDIAGQPRPVADLGAREGVRLGVGRPARDGVAIEVFQLRGDLADDARLAFRRQLLERQVRPDERRPLTHESAPSRR
jgi:hypothetical protein